MEFIIICGCVFYLFLHQEKILSVRNEGSIYLFYYNRRVFLFYRKTLFRIGSKNPLNYSHRT